MSNDARARCGINREKVLRYARKWLDTALTRARQARLPSPWTGRGIWKSEWNERLDEKESEAPSSSPLPGQGEGLRAERGNMKVQLYTNPG
jgi:hypothetical protein